MPIFGSDIEKEIKEVKEQIDNLSKTQKNDFDKFTNHLTILINTIIGQKTINCCSNQSIPNRYGWYKLKFFKPNERLVGKYFLIYSKSEGLLIAQMASNLCRFNFFKGRIYIEDVEYWMEIPDLPELIFLNKDCQNKE